MRGVIGAAAATAILVIIEVAVKVVRDAGIFEAGDTGRNSTWKSLNSLSMI